MDKLRLIILLTSLAFSNPIAFAQGKLSEAHSRGLAPVEHTALKDWGNRYRSSSGPLLTPPRGRIDTEIKTIQQFIQNMVNVLSETRAQKNGLNIVVNLYPSDQFNAFAAEALPEEIDQPDSTENNTQLHRFIQRRFLGYDDQQRPIHEVGIHLGLLKILKTDAELAFVLAHELSHIFENHTQVMTKIRDRRDQLWDRQIHEAVADQSAIDLMVGHYEIEESLLALEKITPKKEGQEQIEYVFFANHHHEGVRFALLQGYIEFLRRNSDKASPLTVNPLPKFLQITRANRIKTYSTKFDELTLDLRKMIETTLLQPVRFQMLRTLDYNYLKSKSKPLMPLEPVLQKIIENRVIPGSEQIGTFLVEAFHIIQNSDVSKQLKVDAFIKLLYVFEFSLDMGTRVLNDIWKDVNNQTLSEITRFLAENSQGEDHWSYSKSQLSLEALTGDDERAGIDHTLFGKLFLVNNKSQKLIQFLVQTNPEWKSFFNSFVNGVTKPFLASGDLIDLGNFKLILEDIVRCVYQYGPLSERMMEDILATFTNPTFLKTLHSEKSFFDPYFFLFIEASELTQREHATSYSQSEENEAKLQAEYSLRFQNKLRTALKPTIKAYSKHRYSFTKNFLSYPSEDHKDIFHFMELATKSLKYAPADQKFHELLQHNLMPFIKLLNKNYWLPSYGTHRFHEILDNMLSSNQYSRAEKIEIFKTMIMSSSAKTNIKGFFDEDYQAEGLRSFVNTLTKEDLFSFMEPSPSLSDIVQQFPLDETDRTVVYDKAIELVRRYFGQISVLNAFTMDKNYRRVFAQSLEISDLKRLIRDINLTHQAFYPFVKAYRTMGTPASSLELKSIASDSIAFMLDVLALKTSEYLQFSEWVQTYEQICKLYEPYGLAAIDLGADHTTVFESYILKMFSNMSTSEIYSWIQRPHVRRNLKIEKVSKLLLYSIKAALPNSKNPDVLAREFERVVEKLNLKSKNPELYSVLKEDLSQEFLLQPNQIQTVFKEDRASKTSQYSGFDSHIRGLSAIVAVNRNQTVPEQIAMIEYLMGASDQMPNFVKSQTLRGIGNFAELLSHLKAQLKNESDLNRVMIVNSFLAGPNSFIKNEKDLQLLIDHLLRNVQDQNRELAKVLAQSLLKAQGNSTSLAVAYVMAQKPSQQGTMTEADILRSLFQAYGVPGIKLGQYLAFTNEFAEYREAFASLQDAAMPITYLAAIELVRQRLGENWDTSYKILGIKGSGSVNIAVEYYNPQSKQNEILNISRSEIEVSLAHDFRRYNAFLQALTSTPERMSKFGFLIGLSKVIEQSVQLELKKELSFEMQNSVQKNYNHNIDGWAVRTVKTFELLPMAIRMEKAAGQSARTVFNSSPAIYRSAMTALAKAELDVLMGVDADGSPRPVSLHANPDFHDGQVLIDETNKVVTFIDFGQAVPISNREREQAIDILRIVAKAESLDKSTNMMNTILNDIGASQKITKEELNEVLEKGQRMDIFVRLISLVSRKGGNLPLSIIHWVLAANRQIVLSDKINWSAESQIKLLIGFKKIGANMTVYNSVRNWKKFLPSIFKSNTQSEPNAVQCRDLFR